MLPCSAYSYEKWAIGEAQDPVKVIKTDTTGAREKEISMESSLKELQRVIAECKAVAKTVDDLVNVVIKAVTENDFDVDEDTVLLIDKATSASNVAPEN
ncbi:hypothetical protein V6N13_088520 [Hibiscus sabdariffa]|uniref:Uncharacterized protein n=1 Tax=Hibiscus sabdariffa TaxID=183260 RepID=A0ABR2FZJ5_9ROSI